MQRHEWLEKQSTFKDEIGLIVHQRFVKARKLLNKSIMEGVMNTFFSMAGQCEDLILTINKLLEA